jgi:hypothetical protein
MCIYKEARHLTWYNTQHKLSISAVRKFEEDNQWQGEDVLVTYLGQVVRYSVMV